MSLWSVHLDYRVYLYASIALVDFDRLNRTHYHIKKFYIRYYQNPFVYAIQIDLI